MKHLAVLILVVATVGCGGGSSSPTSPSAPQSSGPFNGTWSGTYGGAAAVPMTLTLTQNGSTVTGTTVITCPLCGDGRSNLNGTASGSVASVAFFHPGQNTPYLQGVTLTIAGASMTSSWPGGNGATITGTFTSGAAPPTAAPAPSPTPTPGSYAVSITAAACTIVSRDNFRTYYTITASGSITGPDTNAGLVVASNHLGTGLVENVSCGSWTKAAANSLGVDCQRQSGNPATTTWSVAFTNHSVGHQQADFGFSVGAHARNPTSGNFSDSETVALDCNR